MISFFRGACAPPQPWLALPVIIFINICHFVSVVCFYCALMQWFALLNIFVYVINVLINPLYMSLSNISF